MKTLITKTIFFVFILSFFSCSVHEGEGGRSSIHGTLKVEYYNKTFSKLIATEPAKDEDVFIHYGDNLAVDDKIETSAEGCFCFQYLYEGNYTICYYSEDSTLSVVDEIEIMQALTIGKDEDLYLEDGVIIKTLDYNDGHASILGSVQMVVYDKDSSWPYLIPEETIPAQDYEVYLVYEQEAGYTERVRTDSKGMFCFENLIPGEYSVYVYSEDLQGNHQMAVVEQVVLVDDMNETVEMNEFEVHNL